MAQSPSQGGRRRIAAVVNPAAGRARGAKLREEALAELARLADVTTFRTERPGHATELARAAAEQGYEIVAAVGGDGTFREVGTGLLKTGSATRFGFPAKPLTDSAMALIPVGSGNDLCKTLGIPTDVRAACRVAVSGSRRGLDAARVETPGGVSHFVNAAGFGFDAAVVSEAVKLPGLRGLPLYVAAVFRAVGGLQCPNVRVTLGGRTWEQPVLMVAAANGRCYGGGMKIAPEAETDDGLLEVCLIDRVGKFKVVRCLPSFIQGTHGRIPEVHFFRVPELTLEFLDPVPVQFDGDLLGPVPFAGTYRITVLPAALRVIVPAGAVG
jgi:YegS/Rv2252/BmrU family lipid kinase